MALVKLSSREAAKLEKLLTATEDVRQWKRTQALLWLAEGDSVEEVAERLRVKGRALADRPTRSIDESADAACRYILEMTPQERLRKAGVLSGNCWLTK
jgi:hypothetical protein